MRGRQVLTFWLVAATTFLLDQVSKSVVRALWDAPAAAIPWDDAVAGRLAPVFGPFESLPILGRVLMLTHVRNTGAAFGLFPGFQPVFIATSIAVLVVVAVYWWRARPTQWLVVIALGLVCGGAAGNLVDRAVLGRVTDFFYVAVIDFPVFNVADSAVVVGVAMLAGWLLFTPGPGDASEPSSKAGESADAVVPTDEPTQPESGAGPTNAAAQ